MRAGTFAADDAELISSCIRKNRIYVAPFAVSKYGAVGKGFVFVQSSCPLADLAYTGHVTETGRRLERHLNVGYFTLTDFGNKLAKDHPGLLAVRDGLEKLVNSYESSKQMAVLFIGGCGSLNLLTVQVGGLYSESIAWQQNLTGPAAPLCLTPKAPVH